MANLAALLSRRRECDNRAQLILITAFALAAIFLGLAIIVNSAIFTENLATRSENVESTEALEYRYGVTQFTGDVIEVANENNHTSHDDIRENVSDGILDANDYSGIQQVEGGAAVSLELSETTNGSRIFQNDGSNFTNNESNSTWTLVEEVNNTRAFELEISEFTNSEEFSIIANDTDTPDEDWKLEISADEVTVTRQDVSEPESCTVGTVESVDVTGATVNGQACPALEDSEEGDPMQFAAGIDDEYTIEFKGGDEINGSYSLVIEDGSDGEVSGIDDADYAEIDGPGESPYVVPAMYSATLDLDYETSRVEYQTAVRVAPGEPR